MAAKTFYLKDALAGSSNHLSLQDGGSAPSQVHISSGWRVGTTAPTVYARMDSQTERGLADLGATPQPDGAPNNTLGDCFRSENTINGQFANANWSLSFQVEGESRSTSTTDGRLRVRIWKSANQDGSSAVELTGAVLSTTQFTDLANSAFQTITVTWSPGETKTLTNEYLFVQVAFQLDGAGNNVNADVHLAVGSSNSVITSDFTPAAVSLTIQDAAHGHSADNIALTQHNILAVQDAAHGHGADNVTLTAHEPSVQLVIQDAAHAHGADSPSLIQHNVLSIAEAAHGHAAENIALTQHHILAVQDAAHAHGADSPSLIQHNVLSIADGAHGHAAENISLTQHHILAMQDAAHEHTAESIALIQHHVLTITDASHGHNADNVTLTAYEPGGITLTIQDASHTHAADEISLLQHHVLTIAGASHTHISESLALVQHNILSIADAAHVHGADAVILVPHEPGGGPDYEMGIYLGLFKGVDKEMVSL